MPTGQKLNMTLPDPNELLISQIQQMNTLAIQVMNNSDIGSEKKKKNAKVGKAPDKNATKRAGTYKNGSPSPVRLNKQQFNSFLK